VSVGASGWTELLAAAASIHATATRHAPELAGLQLVAVGWATVESDRACDELDELLGAASWLPLDRDPLLGARARRRVPRPVPGDEVDLLVLEPDTEGRVAAFLARFGEGVAVVYVRAPMGADDASMAIGRVVRGGPAWGPHVVVLGDR
jgi:hypothetical protein